MTNAIDMYRENILENYKNPKNFEKTKDKPTNIATGYNTLCGDKINVEMVIDNNKLKEIGFSGSGCAISIASASLLGEKIKGMDVSKIKKLKKETILNLLEIPIGQVRLKCALLPLETIQKALK